jgi:rhodanese-related sulfurtransferase
MRRALLFVLLAASLALIGVGVVQLIQTRTTALIAPRVVVATQVPTDDVRRISVQELSNRLQGSNPPLVWEYRTADAYAQGHLPGSRWVQIEETATLAKNLDRKQPIVTLCAWPDEATSARAAQILQGLGFSDVAALKGGSAAWMAAGLPVVKGQ